MSDATIVYYTANHERPDFEKRIQEEIVRASGGELPIISVSQKPIDFGENICVGQVGRSGHNAFRQFQIGAEAARTKYVIPAESDMIYPEEYFRYRPPTDDRFYIADPLWVLFAQRGYGKYYCLKHRGSEAAMVVDREFLLNRMKSMFEGNTMWGPVEEEIWLLRRQPVERFVMKTPVLTIKTDYNMHKKTPHLTETRVRELDPYGDSRVFITRWVYGREPDTAAQL